MIEDIVPLIPVHFFSIKLPCYATKRRHLEKEHQLPHLTELCKQKPLAHLMMGWHKEGIALRICPQKPIESLEFFFDTRDRKTMGYPTRFCHHFVIDVERLEGSEVTRFRTDDAHELCEGSLIDCRLDEDIVVLWFPKQVLFGYEPAQFNRLGFTYRINRGEQNFSVIDADFAIEKHPSLWSTLTLEKG